MIKPDPGKVSAAWTAVLAGAYERAARPVMFACDPEEIHERMIAGLSKVGPRMAGLAAAAIAGERTPVTVAGIDFGGRVGLAAGLDKDATAAAAWAGLGFGFAELGTVTPRAQPGNDRPRIFRAPASKAIINRMGFNNRGSGALAAQLRRSGVRRGNLALGIRLGISVGKNKLTPNERAADDYRAALADVAEVADYVAINVSSPNTPGLRALQAADELTGLVADVVSAAGDLDAESALPVFVKISPDIEPDQLAASVAAIEAGGAAAIIATNTTLARTGLAAVDQQLAAEAGGLSGAPLTNRAAAVVEQITARTQLPVVAVGGIMTADDARRMFEAGAQLVQLYTGFIYSGPALVRACNAVSKEWS